MKKRVVAISVLCMLAPLAAGAADPGAAAIPAATIDPNDPYCRGWSPADKKVFLKKQKGVNFKNKLGGPDSAEFVFYYSPAHHGHGAPEGSCGMRVEIFKKDDKGERVRTGVWEDPVLSHLFMASAGDHYCYFSALGDTPDGNDTGGLYIIDDKGQVQWRGKWTVPEMAVWIAKEGRELLWLTMWSDISMMAPDGTVLWSRSGDKEDSYYGTFISADRRFAFHLKEKPPQRGVIYDQDGNTVCEYVVPFEREKAQKGLLGLNDKGELVLRVNRRIYSVSKEGVPRLEAELPVHKGRHFSVETMRPGIHFDVGFNYGAVQHQYDYATNVERPGDHPRPMVRFNINDFKAEGSRDEGKNWHPINIRAPDPGKIK